LDLPQKYFAKSTFPLATLEAVVDGKLMVGGKMESDELLYQDFCKEYQTVIYTLENLQSTVSSDSENLFDQANNNASSAFDDLKWNLKNHKWAKGYDGVLETVFQGGASVFFKAKATGHKLAASYKEASVILDDSLTVKLLKSYQNILTNNKYSIHAPAALNLLKRIKIHLSEGRKKEFNL